MTPAVTDTALFSVRVTADGCACHFVVYPNGVRIGPKPGRGRLVTFTEVSRLSDGPPADRYGVVVNGRLSHVYEEEHEAHDTAANHRTLGVEAVVIRVPVTVGT